MSARPAWPVGQSPGDYTQIYPEDEYMEELTDHARVWRIYNDEADRRETEMVEGWRSTLDTLLIFAGLFSAVVATFVIQTTQNLKPDNMEVTASLVTELVGLQRATATQGNPTSIPNSPLTHDTPFMPATRDIWLNGIWIISLVLTLIVALISSLVKQWIHYYVADATGSPRTRACVRQYRLMGLRKWRVTYLVGFLPVLMNVSLLLFFIGLILFFQGLEGSAVITILIICLTFFSFAFYIGTSSLPVWDAQCPYKTSLTGGVNLFTDMFCVYLRVSQRCGRILIRHRKYIWRRIRRSMRFRAHSKSSSMIKRLPADKEGGGVETGDYAQEGPRVLNGLELPHGPTLSMSQELAVNRTDETWVSRLIHSLSRRSAIVGFETHTVMGLQQTLCPKAIEEMACRSTNPVVSSISLQAIAGIHHENSPFKGADLPAALRSQLRAAIIGCVQDSDPWHQSDQLTVLAHRNRVLGSPTMVERFARGILCLPDFSALDGNQVRSIVACTPIKNALDLRIAALLNFPGTDRYGLNWIFPQRPGALEDTVQHVIGRVLALPRIEVGELHPWAYRQLRIPFSNLIPGKIAARAKRDVPGIGLLVSGDYILGQLISDLSVDKVPSLQDEMSFLLLYTLYGPGAVHHIDLGAIRDFIDLAHFDWSDNDLPAIDAEVGEPFCLWNNAAAFLHVNNQTGPDLKSHFILILPALAREALSGEVANMDNFSQLALALVTPPDRALKISPWSESKLSRRLTEHVVATILHQFIFTEWNIYGKEGHTRFSICIRTIGYLLRIDKFYWRLQTLEYFLQIHKTIWFLLKWYMSLSADQARVGSESYMDTEQLRNILEEYFERWNLYDFGDEDTTWNSHHFTSQVTSKRILALPTWLLDTPYFKCLSAGDMDTLFSHFFRLGDHQANPEYPATEKDRSRTLHALIQVVSYHLQETKIDPNWEQLLASWRDRLVNETVGTGSAEIPEESNDGVTPRNEDGYINSSAIRSEREINSEILSVMDPPASPVEISYEIPDLLDSIDRALLGAKANASSAISSTPPCDPSPPDRSSVPEPEPDRLPEEHSTSFPPPGSQAGPVFTPEVSLGDNGSETCRGRDHPSDAQGEPPATTMVSASETRSQSSAMIDRAQEEADKVGGGSPTEDTPGEPPEAPGR